MAVLEQRYAGALLDVALAKGELPQVSTAMERVGEALKTEELRSFLFNPRTARESKLKVLGQVAGNLDGTFGTFLKVLLDRRREVSLRGICKLFHEYALAARGAVEGVLESAKPISSEEVAALSAALAHALGCKEVILSVHEKPHLLGGIRVQVGGRLYDSSALGRLEEMRRNLMAAPL